MKTVNQINSSHDVLSMGTIDLIKQFFYDSIMGYLLHVLRMG